MPLEGDVDAEIGRQSLGPVRSAYVRIVQEEEEKIGRAKMVPGDDQGLVPLATDRTDENQRGRWPVIRAGPEGAALNKTNSNPIAADAPHTSDGTAKAYFNNLEKLRKPAT